MPLGLKHRSQFPQIIEENGVQMVSGIVDGTTVGYKYFDLLANTRLTMKIRGSAAGTLAVCSEENGKHIGNIKVEAGDGWHEVTTVLDNKAGQSALFLPFRGSGKLEMLELTLGEDRHEDYD